MDRHEVIEKYCKCLQLVRLQALLLNKRKSRNDHRCYREYEQTFKSRLQKTILTNNIIQKLLKINKIQHDLRISRRTKSY